MGYTSKLNTDDHRRAQIFARLTYVGVMLTFLTLCTVAVIVTMKQEKEKEGFKAIKVSQPISFFDKTYLKDEAQTPDVQNAQGTQE